MSGSWDPMDCIPPGSSVHEIFQARMLEWVAISFSRESSQPRDETTLICGSSSTTREARIYNVEKTASLINGVGKTICEVRSLSRV